MNAKFGRKTKVCLPPHLVKATCAMMRCTSSSCSGPVTRSFFPAGHWELEKVALSCPHGPGHAVPGNARGLVDAWLPDESCVKEGRRK